jgi:orotidine-5'-phosphate decarboxylase
MNFGEKLRQATLKNNSLVCVGLDTDPKLVPGNISVYEFNKAIVEATSDLVCAYKPNLAFYEAMGDEGMEALKQTVKCIPSTYRSSVTPSGRYRQYLEGLRQGAFRLLRLRCGHGEPLPGLRCHRAFPAIKIKAASFSAAPPMPAQRTSNHCAVKPRPVSVPCSKSWRTRLNSGTPTAYRAGGRRNLPRGTQDHPPAAPGYAYPDTRGGAQGGDVALTVEYGTTPQGDKAIINSSRQIIFASKGKDFAEAARKAAMTLRDEINKHRGK